MDELSEVVRVLRCSTHYEVLKLNEPDYAPVFIDVQQVRKHYKDLAILVHPDKNRTTDAESAFKRLSEAYECLVDELSQRNYLQQLQSKTQLKRARQKPTYKRKRKTPSKSASEENISLPKRRLWTSEQIRQKFLREEEELARQHFHAKGFDRVYESTIKQPAHVAGDAASSTEEQHTVLNSDLDLKAKKWTRWNKPGLESVFEHGARSNTRAVSSTLICCLLCRRKFSSVDALHRHEALSKLHLMNVQAKQS